MEELMLKKFGENEIRIIMRDNEPWFVAKDVADVLEIKNVSDAISRLDDDERNTIGLNEGNRGNPNVAIVNESGMYSLVMTSRKPEAKAFKKWVTSEVLPSIRKTGSYSQLSPLEVLQQTVNRMVEMEREMNQQLSLVASKADEVAERLNHIETAHDHFTIIGYFSHIGKGSINLKNASICGKTATKYCMNYGIEMGNIPDPRFGRVNTYPKYVLDLLFDNGE